MAQAQLESLREALQGRSREELEEFAFAGAMAHAEFCGIACSHPPGHGEEHRHATEAEMRSRIQGMGTDELTGVLAWSVLTSEAVPGRGGMR